LLYVKASVSVCVRILLGDIAMAISRVRASARHLGRARICLDGLGLGLVLGMRLGSGIGAIDGVRIRVIIGVSFRL
jgi:hypothetical protein